MEQLTQVEAVTDEPAAASEPSLTPRDRWINLLIAFPILLLFSYLGIALSRESQGVATIWFTNGMLFSIIITRPRSAWWRYFLIGFLADTIADCLWGDPFRLSAGVAFANFVEVASSTLILTRWFGHPFNLSRRRPLLGFLLVAVIGATALTSALGASWTLLFVKAGPWWALFRAWYLGDILGMSIMAPLVFILLRPGFFDMLRLPNLPRTLLFMAAPAVLTFAVFTHNADPLIFFIFPALLLVVFRLGFPGAVLTIFVIACISIRLTATGHGPLMLIHDSMLHRIVIAQIFLAVAIFTAFPVAALLEDRKALERSLAASEAKYRALANADSLTGLANRRAFDARLDAEWRHASALHQPLAALLIDVDHFKSYNDTHGHLSGDRCLRHIAEAISTNLHRPTDTAARFGGEEFTVILPGTTIEEALDIAETLRQAVAAMRLPHAGNTCGGIQTISIGVASTIPTSDNPPLSLLKSCDEALYFAKQQGRNQVKAASAIPHTTDLEDAEPIAPQLP